MFGHRSGLDDMATQSWVELVLATPIVLWAGWPFFVRGGSRCATAARTCGR
jgi:Cu+-exporting ATPase